MRKKVLITGNSGVLGKNLVQYLERQAGGQYELVLFDISQIPEHEAKYTTFKGDIRDTAAVRELMRDIDIVVHCASASPSFPDEQILDIIVGGTGNLLDCAFGANQVERFVYISSTSVYGVPQKAPTYETDEVQPYDAYNKGKIKAEELCSAWRDRGKCVTVLRPRSFLGPHRLGTFAILYEWASEGRHFPMLGPGSNRYQLLDVEDLCQAVYLAMSGAPDNVNDLFNIGAGEFTTIKEDYQAVLDEAGFGKKIISLPARPIIAVLQVLEKLKLSPFYKRLYMKLNRDYYVSLDKAATKLGYRPLYSNKQSLVRNYHWYLENRKHAKSPGLGNNAVWNQGVLKYAKIFF